MSNLMESIDSRTKLVGENRLELLMFRLKGKQIFAINVFKIQEVVQVPPLTEMPHSHSAICGVAHLRGRAIPVIDLNVAIGRTPIADRENGNLIVTEYNQSVQGFLVGSVDRIINLNWDSILPPPKASGKEHFLTAFTRVNEEIVEILDVERVLADIIPPTTQVSEDVIQRDLLDLVKGKKLEILSVDDSTTARRQIIETIANLNMGIIVRTANDGLKGLTLLEKMSEECDDVSSELLMVITDAEMPEMDGYRMTHEIRNNPKLKNLHIVMHTSLSGSFNEAMVEKVGCDGFLSKFRPDALAAIIQERIRQVYG
ncbi:chemotaxis protein CheW [Candidatus Endobugula sertula]|uniref:Chemotaxis protein CheW n=1 Tax=Candidatus Endobugula sertula TaxID=62101 RepID=A0A1D2QQF6_9GAMM|nr:chemotaxis protein CheW [Candidatus Endobugula sertula]